MECLLGARPWHQGPVGTTPLFLTAVAWGGYRRDPHFTARGMEARRGDQKRCTLIEHTYLGERCAKCCTYMNSPVLTGIPWGRYCPRVLGYYYHPHFTDKEKEARELTHPTQRRPDGTWWSQASHPVLSKPSASGPGSGGWSIWGWNSDPAGTHPAVLPYRKFGLHHGYPAHRGLEELFASSAPLLAHVMGEGQWGPKEVQPRVKGELRQRSACCILTC